MRYIGISILLVLCLTLLLFTCCTRDIIAPEPANGNLANQEDLNQSINNSQSSSTGQIYETVIADTEDPEMISPQKWTTGDGTAENPWANDCIQKAYDFVPAGGTIFLKAGYYKLAAKLEINKQVNIIGEGRNITIIKTANAIGFQVNADYTSIKNLTVDGAAQTDGGGVCINSSQADYLLFENIEVKNAGYYGLNMNDPNYCTLRNIHAHDNYRHGVHAGANYADNNQNNTYSDIYCWDNGVDGFDDRGSIVDPNEQMNNVYDNLQCWNNGQIGIAIAHQRGGVLSNSSASGNGKNGIWLSIVEDFNVHDCSTTLNGGEGIHIISSINVNLTNVISKNANYSGVRVDDSSDIKLTSCQSYDDRVTPLQKWGMELNGTNDKISLVYCILMPNKEGEIYNPAGVAVIVITEKMLAKF